jgi:small-conductance mechanosensitive channel
VNNFVSGLILLFERPVKVGDTIQLGTDWGKIERIGLRATVVETFDMSEVIVPNSDLISAQVTNWTLRNRLSRVIVPVGIAYGSDVPLAMKLLREVAGESLSVMKQPEPQVLFLAFGASSLDFELRVWVANVDDRLTVRSELHQEIDRRFREAKVEIAFPQQDLHLRTVDGEARDALASLLPTPTAGAAPQGKGRKKATGSTASRRRAEADEPADAD